MLLRTASTPALTSLPVVAAEKFGEEFASSGFGQQAFTIEARFRKAQSESDLQSVGNHLAPAACTAAAAFPRYDHAENNTTTPQKRWSRRLSGLRRGSSLPPSIPGSISEMDCLLEELQTSLPGLQEYTAGEETTCSNKPLELQSFESEPSPSGREGSHSLRVDSSVNSTDYSWDVGLKEAVGPSSFVGGFGIGSTGGRSNFGFGGGGSYDNSSDDIDAYYRKMIKENPSNSLLLRNYARYLQEEKRDFSRAEEFYERAILAAPDDAEVRTKYAKLIWEFRGDEERAECYFEQATQTSPDDCHVLGAYAAFLWDVEEEHDTPLVLTGIL